MKKISLLLVVIYILFGVQSACAVTETQKTKLKKLSYTLETLASEYDYGDTFKDPEFSYEEETNQFIMVFEATDIDGETGRMLAEYMPETFYDSFFDMCISGYNIIKDATEDIVDDLYIVVGITGSDQEIIMYTLNGKDFTDIVVE